MLPPNSGSITGSGGAGTANDSGLNVDGSRPPHPSTLCVCMPRASDCANDGASDCASDCANDGASNGAWAGGSAGCGSGHSACKAAHGWSAGIWAANQTSAAAGATDACASTNPSIP